VKIQRRVGNVEQAQESAEGEEKNEDGEPDARAGRGHVVSEK
jgi:hypothetical protein